MGQALLRRVRIDGKQPEVRFEGRGVQFQTPFQSMYSTQVPQ